MKSGIDELAGWLDHQSISVSATIVTIALLIIAFIVFLLLNRMLRSRLARLENALNLPYGFVVTATRILTAALWALTALLVLQVWGIGIGGIWTLFVSIATLIGVGFLATWTLISNFTASFLIAIWRPFRLGETVELPSDNLKGRVIDRNLMFTVLREESGDVVEIPNNMFFQRIVRVVGRKEKSPFELVETLGSTQAPRQERPRPVLQPSRGASL